jgi:hypothetical protein
MIPPALAQLEARLRQASAKRRYGDVERLALEFADAARAEIGKLAPGDPAVAALAQSAAGVLERTRLITITGRARTAQELRGLPFPGRYVRHTPPRPPMFRIDA